MGRNSRDAYHQYKQVRDLLYGESHWDCERGVTPQFVLDLIIDKRRDIHEQLCLGQRGRHSNPLQSVKSLLHKRSKESAKVSDYPFTKISAPKESPPRFSLKPELLRTRRAAYATAADEKQIAAADKRRERRAQRKADIEAWEGAKVQRRNNERERGAVAQAFKKQLAHFRCEVCEFDFEAIYGREARGFIEAHHKDPLMNGERRTTIADFNAVCGNCHRMLHLKRHPFRTVEELRRIIVWCRLAAAQLILWCGEIGMLAPSAARQQFWRLTSIHALSGGLRQRARNSHGGVRQLAPRD